MSADNVGLQIFLVATIAVMAIVGLVLARLSDPILLGSLPLEFRSHEIVVFESGGAYMKGRKRSIRLDEIAEVKMFR